MKSDRKLIKDNPRQVLKILLNRLGYPYTSDLYGQLKEHPDFPSFLSYHHLFNRLEIGNAALSASYDELKDELPLPAIAHVTTNVELFLVIDAVDDEQVYILNEQNLREPVAREDFMRMWQGNLIVTDAASVPKPERNRQVKAQQALAKLRKPFVIAIGVALVSFFAVAQPRSWLSWVFLFLYAVGLVFAVLLVVQQLDKHNTFIRKLCTSGKQGSRRSCSSILDSKAAYFMGLFSWTDFGFLFLAALFTVVLLFPEAGVTVAILSSIPAFGYVFYSLYYQKFIARSWCTLCLGVQAVLSALFGLSISTLSYVNISLVFSYPVILMLLLTAAAVVAAYVAIKPLLQAKYAVEPLSYKFKSLKHRDDVRELLLSCEQQVTVGGIIPIKLGNIGASTCVTVVFSPVCAPCMEELLTLIPIYKAKKDTRLELIIIADDDTHTDARNISRNLMRKYVDKPNDFLNTLEQYARCYPASRFKLGGEPEGVEPIDEILDGYEQWGRANGIYSTPTMYVNYQRVGSMYSTKDIDYLCY